MIDSIVDNVRQDLLNRSMTGVKKYQTTLDRTDLGLLEWLNHQYEELLDAALYCKRAIKELDHENHITLKLSNTAKEKLDEVRRLALNEVIKPKIEDNPLYDLNVKCGEIQGKSGTFSWAYKYKPEETIPSYYFQKNAFFVDRPTLSVDQLLNRDDYPDFHENA